MDGGKGLEGSCRGGLGWQVKDDAANDRNNLAVGRKSICDAVVLPFRSCPDLGGCGSRLVVNGVLFQGGTE